MDSEVSSLIIFLSDTRLTVVTTTSTLAVWLQYFFTVTYASDSY